MSYDNPTEDKLRRQLDEADRLLSGRAGKLLKKGKTFIVVAVDEPYFRKVYEMIRDEEVRNGTWSQEDTDRMAQAVHEWADVRADARLSASAPRSTARGTAPALLEALADVGLRATQARLGSNIGRQTLKTVDFLRGELKRIGAVARAAIDEVSP